MKVITLIAIFILITGALVIFLPEIAGMNQPAEFLSSSLNQVGDLSAQVGIKDVASLAYDTSLSIKPDNYDSLEEKGDILASSGKHLEALTVYTKTLEQNPNNLAVMKKKSDVLKTLGRTEESRDLLLKIAYAQPADMSDQLTIVQSSISSGQYTQAIHKTDEILKNQPNNPDVWELRGDAYIGLATANSSLMNQLSVLQTGSRADSDDVHDVLNKNQAFSDGIQSYRQELELDPMRSTDLSQKIFTNLQGFDIMIQSGDLL